MWPAHEYLSHVYLTSRGKVKVCGNETNANQIYHSPPSQNSQRHMQVSHNQFFEGLVNLLLSRQTGVHQRELCDVKASARDIGRQYRPSDQEEPDLPPSLERWKTVR